MKLETIEKLFDLMFFKKTSDKKKGFKMIKKTRHQRTVRA